MYHSNLTKNIEFDHLPNTHNFGRKVPLRSHFCPSVDLGINFLMSVKLRPLLFYLSFSIQKCAPKRENSQKVQEWPMFWESFLIIIIEYRSGFFKDIVWYIPGLGFKPETI